MAVMYLFPWYLILTGDKYRDSTSNPKPYSGNAYTEALAESS